MDRFKTKKFPIFNYLDPDATYTVPYITFKLIAFKEIII